MARPSSRHIKDLTDTDIQKLTNLLSAPSAAPQPLSWFNSQAEKIHKLPKTLLRPQGVLGRSVSALRKPFERLNIVEERAHLCKTHKPLNAHVIRRLFLKISSECTVRNARLQKADGLPNNVAQYVGRIMMVNSLWMSAALYLFTFVLQSDTPHFDRIESGCEACIIASIGSNLQVLLDLQASALSRRRGNTHPEILRFLDEWIFQIGGSHLKDENAVLAQEIRQCRKDLHAERYHGKERKRYDRKPSQSSRTASRAELQRAVSTGGQSALDRFDFGFQGNYETQNSEAEDDAPAALTGASIADYYTSRMSTNNDDTASTLPAESMHPAFRESMHFSGSSKSQSGYSKRGRSSSRPPVAPHEYNLRDQTVQFDTGFSLGEKNNRTRELPMPRPSPGVKRTASMYTASVYSTKTSGRGSNKGRSASAHTTRPPLPSVDSMYNVFQDPRPATSTGSRYRPGGYQPSPALTEMAASIYGDSPGTSPASTSPASTARASNSSSSRHRGRRTSSPSRGEEGESRYGRGGYANMGTISPNTSPSSTSGYSDYNPYAPWQPNLPPRTGSNYKTRTPSHTHPPAQNPNTISPSPPKSVWEDEEVFTDDGRSVAETTYTTRETLRAAQEEQDKAFRELTGMSKEEYNRQHESPTKRGGNVRGAPPISMMNSRPPGIDLTSEEGRYGSSSARDLASPMGGSDILRGMRDPSPGASSVASEETTWSAFGRQPR